MPDRETTYDKHKKELQEVNQILNELRTRSDAETNKPLLDAIAILAQIVGSMNNHSAFQNWRQN